MALRMTRGGMDVFCADDFVVMLAPHCGDGARVAPRTLAVLRCEPKKFIGQTIRTKGVIPAKALTETYSSQEACKYETQHRSSRLGTVPEYGTIITLRSHTAESARPCGSPESHRPPGPPVCWQNRRRCPSDPCHRASVPTSRPGSARLQRESRATPTTRPTGRYSLTPPQRRPVLLIARSQQEARDARTITRAIHGDKRPFGGKSGASLHPLLLRERGTTPLRLVQTVRSTQGWFFPLGDPRPRYSCTTRDPASEPGPPASRATRNR